MSDMGGLKNSLINLERVIADKVIEQQAAEVTRLRGELETVTAERDKSRGMIDAMAETRDAALQNMTAATAALDAARADGVAEGRDWAVAGLSGPMWRMILRDEGCDNGGPCSEGLACECRDKHARLIAFALIPAPPVATPGDSEGGEG